VPDTLPARGYTVRDLARRYRVSEDRVRVWIARGELVALNTRDVRCGRPRWVVTAEALVAFERSRQAKPPAPSPKRRKRTMAVDFYPDS
jgi:transposase